MDSFVDKISTYNIFNYLFPGVVFLALMSKLTTYNFEFGGIFQTLVVGYFFGLLISRIGSIILEPIFKLIRVTKYENYSDFISASKNDEVISTLSEVANMYRTLCSMTFCLFFAYVYSVINNKHLYTNVIEIIIGLSLIFVLFVLALKKQGEYVTKRIKNAKEQ